MAVGSSCALNHLAISGRSMMGSGGGLSILKAMPCLVQGWTAFIHPTRCEFQVWSMIPPLPDGRGVWCVTHGRAMDVQLCDCQPDPRIRRGMAGEMG